MMVLWGQWSIYIYIYIFIFVYINGSIHRCFPTSPGTSIVVRPWCLQRSLLALSRALSRRSRRRSSAAATDGATCESGAATGMAAGWGVRHGWSKRWRLKSWENSFFWENDWTLKMIETNDLKMIETDDLKVIETFRLKMIWSWWKMRGGKHRQSPGLGRVTWGYHEANTTSRSPRSMFAGKGLLNRICIYWTSI